MHIMENKIELKLAVEHSEKDDCGKCKYLITNGFMVPGGKCKIHPEFGTDICISRKSFPKYATICDDFKTRRS